jgi:hypothetical protein
MPRNKRKDGRKMRYRVGRLGEREQRKLDAVDALGRSVEKRIKLGFIPMKLPVIDDKNYRVFDTIKEYRTWANKNLPKWLGYSR